MNTSIDADDIYSLMGAVQRSRNPQLPSASSSASPFDYDLSFVRTRPYYEPSLMLSEHNNGGNPHSSRSVPRRPPSSHYSVSDVSVSDTNPSVWDVESAHWATSSVSSAPSRPGRHYQPPNMNPPQLQYRPFPYPHPQPQLQPSSQSQSWSHQQPQSQLTLPCEFIGYGGCDASFPIDQPTEWINHITSVHLRGIFPDHTICWFCDDQHFIAASSALDHRRQAYYARMRHIAGHIVSGEKSTKDMRPDHFFLDHLHDCGLIDHDMFRRAISYHELKLPKGSIKINTVPPPDRAADRGQICVERRRGKESSLQYEPRRVFVHE